MMLDGHQIEAIQNALLSAFDLDDLRRMVRIHLDKDLDDISLATSLEDVTFRLIEWAEKQGKLDLLIQGAYQENPGNPDLKALHDTYFADKPQPEQTAEGNKPVIPIPVKSQKPNWVVIIPIVVAVIGLLGVLITELNKRYLATIPINATKTAEAARTALALLTPPPTNTPTFTITPTLTFTPAPTFTSTPVTPTFTPTPSLTPTLPTPTPLYDVVFEDGFIDNSNGWFNQNETFSNGLIVVSKIAGGKYSITMTCPSGYPDPYCRVNRMVPFDTPQNFYMQFEENIKNPSPNAVWMVGVQYRRIAGYYYIVYFRSKRSIGAQLQEGGQATDIFEQTSMPIKTNTGETNTLGLRADSTDFSIYVNNENVKSFEDGNLKQPGNAFFVFFVYRGSSVTFELDNFMLGGLHK